MERGRRVGARAKLRKIQREFRAFAVVVWRDETECQRTSINLRARALSSSRDSPSTTTTTRNALREILTLLTRDAWVSGRQRRLALRELGAFGFSRFGDSSLFHHS